MRVGGREAGWLALSCIAFVCKPIPPHNTKQIKYRVECRFVKDTLKGDDVNEIRCVPSSCASCCVLLLSRRAHSP